MKEITIKVHEIATDGLPDMDKLVGRVALLFDGNVVNGWPLADLDDEGRPLWEGGDVSNGKSFYGVTHWIEFPDPLWEIERNSPARFTAAKQAR